MTHFSPEAKALFKVARERFDPSEQRKARVRAAALAAAATLAATAPMAAAASKLGGVAGMGVAKSALVVGLGLFLVGGGAVVGLRSVSERALPQVASASMPVKVPLAPASPAARAPEMPALVTPPGEAIRELAAPVPKAGSVPGARSVREPSSDTLAAEVSVLRDARQALQAGHPAQALGLLQGYESLYQRGVLREEALAIRALSLCGLGRVAEATVVASRLEKLSPHSAQLARVKLSCVSQRQNEP